MSMKMSNNRGKSVCWEYFERIPDVQKALCKLCGTAIQTTNSSTSGMVKHLRFKHPAAILEADAKIEQTPKKSKIAPNINEGLNSKSVALKSEAMKVDMVKETVDNNTVENEPNRGEYVKLYPMEEQGQYLQEQFKEMFASNVYDDTKLVCADGDLKINRMLAGLTFPELAQAECFSCFQPEVVVLLPGHNLLDIKKKIDQFFDSKLKPIASKLDSFLEFNVKEELTDDAFVENQQYYPETTFDEDDHLSDNKLDEDEVNQMDEIIEQDSYENDAEFLNGKTLPSLMWDYFVKDKGDSEDDDVGVCKECNHQLKVRDGSTTGMKRHLQSIHPELFEEFVAKTKVREQETNCVKPSLLNRSLLWEYFIRNKNTSPMEDTGVCKECDLEIDTSDDNAGLKAHLREEHLDLYNDFISKNKERKERTQLRCRPKKVNGLFRSVIWDFYSKEKGLGGDPVGVCLECGDAVARKKGESSGLIKHLRLCHLDQYNEYLVKNNDRKLKIQKDVDAGVVEKHGTLLRQPWTGRKSAFIWEFFKKDSEREIATCIECDTVLRSVGGTTSGCIRHLKGKHKTLYKKLVAKNIARQKRMQEKELEQLDRSDEDGPRTNFVWGYFCKDPDSQKAICSLCDKALTYSAGDTISGFRKHLEAKHQDLFEKICFTCKTFVATEEDSAKQCQDCQCRYHEGCVDFSDETGQWRCGFCFKRENLKCTELLRNKERYRKKEKQLCPECGNEFMDVNSHIKKVHKGIKYGKPSQCHICKKILANQGHLNVHIRTVHEKERKHCCKFCERTFPNRFGLKRHVLSMHQGVRVVENAACPDCGRVFRLRCLMLRHQRVVHQGKKVNDNAICEDCGQHFTQRGTLYLHMRKVHGKEPLVDKNKQNRGDQNEKVFIDPALVLQEYPELERDEQFRMNRNLLDPNDETGPSALPTFAF